MFTLEESALLGRMLRSMAVIGFCTIAAAGYLVFRPHPGGAEPARDENGPAVPTVHHHRLRPHQIRHRDRPKLNANSFIFRHIHG